MNDIKVIRTKEDYNEALSLIESLMSTDPDPESEAGEKLSLLAALVEDYESHVFAVEMPNPIEAIKFRMDQAGLKPADLIPYIGSRSRVSEILSGKRSLTVEMMRALEAGLGIPAEVLLKKPEETQDSMYSNWSAALLREMQNAQYFGKSVLNGENGSSLLEAFFSRIALPTQVYGMLRQSNYRAFPTTDKNALTAWAARVFEKASEIKAPKFSSDSIDLAYMQALSKLSIEPNGPVLAQEELRKKGIKLIIEPHLSKTRLDGATLFFDRHNPIIGLTLRHDRLDNFWFTLMHELGHIALHSNDEICFFYDELDEIKGQDIGAKEREADQIAGEALVPADKWEISPAKLIPSSMAANSLAKQLGVHIAIVAGKIRYEGNKYTYLNDVVGESKVRQLFPDLDWNKKK